MRSAFLYIKEHSQDLVRSAFKEIFPQSKTSHYEFQVASHGKEWGWIYLTNEVEGADEDDRISIRRALGKEPSAAIVIDVTGGYDCRNEVRKIVCEILGIYEGVAQDDYSDYIWSPSEIGHANTEGRNFFEPVWSKNSNL